MRITHTIAAAAIGAVALMPMSGAAALAQDATPTAMASCDDAASSMAMGTPDAMAGHMAGMDMGTPGTGMNHAAMGLDLVYIDMMIPHHASIIAMAQAAMPRLEDERLREIAQTIVATQQPEIEELRAFRESIAGEDEPMVMDGAMMAAMDELMPGMSSTMEEMAFQMDSAAQVAAICAAENTDLAFIELTIPHHQMAIEASEVVIEQSERAELRDVAQGVVDAQQREIDALTAIRDDLSGAATPATAGEQSTHAGGSHEGSGAVKGVAGEEILALAPDLIAQIERGEGAGLALPAERNGVPGPRHVLDLSDELGLTAQQQVTVQGIFDEMHAAAIPAGQRYLAAQRALETDFRAGAMDAGSLPARVAEVSRWQGELATIHLAAHVQTAAVLSEDQIAEYVALRSDS